MTGPRGVLYQLPAEMLEDLGASRRRVDDEIAQATQDALTARGIIELHQEMNELRAEVNELKADRDRALRWGLLVIGTAFISLLTWIGNLFVAGKIKP